MTEENLKTDEEIRTELENKIVKYFIEGKIGNRSRELLLLLIKGEEGRSLKVIYNEINIIVKISNSIEEYLEFYNDGKIDKTKFINKIEKIKTNSFIQSLIKMAWITTLNEKIK